MNPIAGQIALIFGSVGLLLGVMVLVRTGARRWAWGAEVQRKLVHLATGCYALTLPALFTEPWPVLLLVALTIVVMAILRSPVIATRGLGSALHGVERKSYGDLLLAIAVGFLFFRSTGTPVLYALPIAVLTLSDAAAALAGSTYGRRVFQVEAGTKSLEGVAVFFLVTWIIAMVMLLLMTDVPRLNVVVLGLMIAAFGALVEADSWRGFDNLFIPVGLHLFLAAHLSTHPLGLIALALGFLAVLSALIGFTKPLGLTPHAARAHAVALFLVCCYTAPQNAIAPTLAVLAHMAARQSIPSRSQFPDLDSLAVLAGVSLAWLFVGEWFGQTAINFYNLTFIGIAAALATLALTARTSRIASAMGGVAIAAALALVFHWIAGLSADGARWYGSLLLPLIATLALVTMATLAWPQAFDRLRSARVALLAGAVPAAAYLTKVLL